MLKVPTITRTFRKWTPEASDALRGYFKCTDWSVLLEAHEDDMEGMTHCVTDYMTTCLDSVVPVTTVCCYHSNKPWITSNVKALLKEKRGPSEMATKTS